MLHICHITPGLGCGGAENTLYRLVSRLDRREFRNTVVSLTGLSHFGPQLTQAMIAVRALNIGVERSWLRGVAVLAQLLHTERPDVIQTWMYWGDLLGSAGALLAGQRRIIWNVRHASLEPGSNKLHTIGAAHLCGWTGHFVPQRIVFCSEESRQLHEGIGYPAAKSLLIENGVDTERFQPDPRARARIREELNISADALVIGLIARFDPLKDHATFIRAAEIVARNRPDTCFVLCGRGMGGDDSAVRAEIFNTGYQDRFRLTDQRSDVEAVMASLDIGCSSSIGESFPNTIAEAMSCGVPCVATNAGASARIVGDCGVVVPISDPEALAQALLAMLSIKADARRKLGERARRRIVSEFNQTSSVEKYASLYASVMGEPGGQAAETVELGTR